MSLKQNIEINKEKQEELKRIQHNKDKGNTCIY